MYDLTNKTAFISGASSGIGEACARAFSKAGAKLILCARRIEKVKSLADQLDSEVYVFQLDVRDKNAVDESIKRLPKEWTDIDILVNNAGLSRGLDILHEGSIQDWEEMIDTNIKGLLYVSRIIIPQMVKKNKGHIINLGSIAGHEMYPKGNVYAATKHAVVALSKGMKMDLLGTNVRVSSVDPGLVETEFSEVRFRGDTEKAKAVYKGMTPLTAEDVADAVLYCATRPDHVNITNVIMLATDQSAATQVSRKGS